MLDWKKEVAPDKYFYCRDGKVFKNIDDMINALGDKNLQQEEGMLRFHISNNNNDFANWIMGVFELKELAEKIRSIKEPEIMIKAINDYKKEHESDNEPKASDEKKQEAPKPVDEKEKARLEALLSEEERLKKNIADLTEESDLLFDKVKKMRMKSYLNKKSMEEKISEIYEEYDEIAASITDWRKKGCDMLIPSLKMKNLKSKMKFMEISQKKDDYDKVVKMMQDIKSEIEDESKHPILNIKQEILEAAGVAKPKAEE